MGRTSGTKAKTSAAKNQSVKAFFTSEDSSSPLPLLPQPKMAAADATATQGEGEQASAITRTEIINILETLELRFAQKVESLLQPIQTQIQDFKSNLQEVSQTAEMALEQSITSQGEIRDLQDGEQRIFDRLLDLENGYRFKNLKFRAFPESAEGTSDLSCFIASWLAQELKLEEGVAPEIDRAYRQGPRVNRRNNLPRDIIVRFKDTRTRNKILKEANIRGSLTYQETQISVFPDLTAETLQKRRELKPITTCLREAKVPYRWVSHYHLSVSHLGKAIQATDVASGCILLTTLGLPLPKSLPETQKDAADASTQKAPWIRIPAD